MSRLSSSSQHAAAQAHLQEQTIQLLGSSLRCIYDPSLPQCPQNSTAAKQLLQKMLNSELGSKQN